VNLIYPCVIHCEKAPDGKGESYWCAFPDLEGCHSFADTIDELLKNAEEALTGYCVTLLDEKRKLPAASSIADIDRSDCDAVAVVEAKLTEKTKSVKKTLTIPAWLNDLAEAEHINFSGVLAEALTQRLNLN